MSLSYKSFALEWSTSSDSIWETVVIIADFLFHLHQTALWNRMFSRTDFEYIVLNELIYNDFDCDWSVPIDWGDIWERDSRNVRLQVSYHQFRAFRSFWGRTHDFAGSGLQDTESHWRKLRCHALFLVEFPLREARTQEEPVPTSRGGWSLRKINSTRSLTLKICANSEVDHVNFSPHFHAHSHMRRSKLPWGQARTHNVSHSK